MPDKLNEDYFEITFSADGQDYEGQVWPDYDNSNSALFQVTFHPIAKPEMGKVVFLDTIEDGIWEQKPVDKDDELSQELIAAIGKEIESSQS